MKLRKSISLRARPLLTVGMAGLLLTACDSFQRSENAVQEQVGRTLDQVVTQWGYPTSEREVAGKKLLLWEEIELSYEGVPQVNIGIPIGTNGSLGATIPLGEPREKVCNRVLEINERQQIVGAAIEGDNCPYYAPNTW